MVKTFNSVFPQHTWNMVLRKFSPLRPQAFKRQAANRFSPQGLLCTMIGQSTQCISDKRKRSRQ